MTTAKKTARKSARKKKIRAKFQNLGLLLKSACLMAEEMGGTGEEKKIFHSSMRIRKRSSLSLWWILSAILFSVDMMRNTTQLLMYSKRCRRSNG